MNSYDDIVELQSYNNIQINCYVRCIVNAAKQKIYGENGLVMLPGKDDGKYVYNLCSKHPRSYTAPGPFAKREKGLVHFHRDFHEIFGKILKKSKSSTMTQLVWEHFYS